MKTKLCVLFGGKSVEHEISVISALQAMENLNADKYEIIPLYISKSGEMYTGDALRNADNFKDLKALCSSSEKVTLVRDGGKVLLVRCPMRRIGKNIISEIDVAFPIVHGTNVEDGALQGYLKTLGVPFVGCDVTASAVGMDKFIMKTVLEAEGFPVLKCLRFNRRRDKLADCVKRIEEAIPYPVIIKPVNLGSSVGISKADSRQSLEEALTEAFGYADCVLAERAIVKLREINCAVVGDSTKAEASECEEPFMHDEILSYSDKYLGGGKGSSKGGAKSSGMASLQRKIPADISAELREEIRTMACRAFQQLGCNGVSRVDFMIDCDENKVYINEFNTIPGSLSFYLWQPLGVPYSQLLDRLISLALKRQREEADITYSFDTNVLAMGGARGSKGTKGAKGCKISD